MPSPDSIRFLTVVISILLILIGLKRTVYAAIGYMVFVYCNVSYYYPFFAQNKAELVFAIIILIRIGLNPGSFRRLLPQYNIVNRYLFVFIITIAASFLFSINYQLSWDYAVYHFIKTMILFAMVIMSLSDEKDLKLFAWSFVLMFIYLAYEPTYSFITGTGGSVQAYGVNYIADVGLLSGHVALANNMNQMIPIAFFLIFSFDKNYKKLFAAIPLIIFFIALVGSGSRGGKLGFLFFAFVLTFFSQKKAKTFITVGIVVIVLFLTSGTFVSTLSRVNIAQTEGRLSGLFHGINFIRFGHVFGVGPGCFALARGRYHGHTMDAHNLYGQVLGELGILGSIAWGFLIWHVFQNLRYAKRKLSEMALEKSFYFYLATGLQISLLVRLFISMGSHGLYYFYWYIVAAMSAVLVVLVNQKKPLLATDHKQA